MNYLAHAVMSFQQRGILAGNIAGDYIKGTLSLQSLPEDIAKGVKLHRLIDEFTDHHPSTQRAAILFREPYRRYAPAIVDTLMDHFLANDTKYFPNSAALYEFSQEAYSLIEMDLHFLPLRFQLLFPYMKSQNWFYQYRVVKGMEQALGGLQRRATYLEDMTPAYQIFIGHYYMLNQCYYELIEDLEKAVKFELSEKP